MILFLNKLIQYALQLTSRILKFDKIYIIKKFPKRHKKVVISYYK